MSKHKWISTVFFLSFVYDGVLGVAFLLAWQRVFAWYDVPVPNHPGYIQFPAILLIVFALLYLAVAREPEANRNLIPYGIGLKLAYTIVVFGHWFSGGIPGMWKPFAVADLAFLALFVWAYAHLRPAPSSSIT